MKKISDNPQVEVLVNTSFEETRIAILRKKAQLDRIEVPDEINAFIAERIDTNIRELEGALNKILALAHLNNEPVTLEIAMQALKDITNIKTKNIIPRINHVANVFIPFFKLYILPYSTLFKI